MCKILNRNYFNKTSLYVILKRRSNGLKEFSSVTFKVTVKCNDCFYFPVNAQIYENKTKEKLARGVQGDKRG